MIDLTNFNNCKIGIFGLGKTGVDSLNAFLTKNTQIFAWDDNKENILRIKKTINKDKNIHFSNVIDPRQDVPPRGRLVMLGFTYWEPCHECR